MKAVILAGGRGTRLSEETVRRPKPMVEIGGKPILWHIMKIYSSHGIHDFVICCGYKGYLIKEYFANYFLHNADVTFDLAKNEMTAHQSTSEPWRVTLVDTGAETATGGRMKLVRDHLDDEEPFCFTYGDAVSDVDVTELVAFHGGHGKLATMTTIQPPSKYGVLAFDGDRITDFQEKPPGEGGWINGGFFVLSPQVIDYIDSPDTPWEYAPLHRLVEEGQLAAHFHKGFWQCMDTLRDRNLLEAYWSSEAPPWKIWE
ncbi:MAG: glucose-1-phosphate cytidylyltransferase [bacterium]|nr:glucose-1-phosphate cytidylyltransferase [bacterium]